MKRFLLALSIVLVCFISRADEGMWMVNLIDKALENKMKDAGLNLPVNVIYDEQNGGLSDAIVSLAFGCTGSMISDDGLMITNHHCAYADVFALSTPEHNYLENGFWAYRRNEEVPVASAENGVYFLKNVIDVSEEAAQIAEEFKLKGKALGGRKLSSILEKRYQKQFPGLDVALYSMYAGEKYYIMAYEVYYDVRLVAAPPVCVGAFGGDIDNWEWPQHKGDFAIYRIYTAPDGSPAKYSKKNVPLHPKRKLTVSTKGISEGDYTMVMGYPGTTNRYASSFEVNALANQIYPVSATLEKERMEIMTKWMNIDPEVRLKYSDRFFMLSNVQEIRESEVYSYNKYGIAEIISNGREKNISKGLLDTLEAKFELLTPYDRQIKYYQECGVRSGSLFKLATKAQNGNDKEAVKAMIDAVDMRVEKEIFKLDLKEIRENIWPEFWGEYLTKLFNENEDVDALADSLWNSSALSSNPYSIKADDPIVKVYFSMKIVEFNNTKKKLEGDMSMHEAKRRYKVETYRNNLAAGVPQYPDANSSMRITYGNVSDLHAQDAVVKLSYSTFKGILEKYDPEDYNFTLDPALLELYKAKDWGRWADEDGIMRVNFLTTNDITGGNSGSPVMNADGELVGLAFDGNKEGLACNIYYDSVLNRCVCVDIRYVLWVLEKYAGMHDIVEEILN